VNNLPKELLFRIDNGIGILTLNRPERHNALTTPMYNSLRELFQFIKSTDEVKVLIITGSGAAFCTGSDVEERLASRIIDGKYIAA
jgi:enoyl-CoA hydratase/carnithine racemase